MQHQLDASLSASYVTLAQGSEHLRVELLTLTWQSSRVNLKPWNVLD